MTVDRQWDVLCTSQTVLRTLHACLMDLGHTAMAKEVETVVDILVTVMDSLKPEAPTAR